MEKKVVKTKSGASITTCYCRKCMRDLIPDNFYDAVDLYQIDSNGKFSVCKDCVQKLYDEVFAETASMEKTIHRLCIMLNIKYSNEAVEATKKHIQTLVDDGKTVTAIFGIYKMKILATNKSMSKSIEEYNGYEDVGVIFTDKVVDSKSMQIPAEVINFWGKTLSREDIEFLEEQYKNFKNTHSAETYAEVVLLKQVCYTLLNIQNLRIAGDDTSDAVKELQNLMKNLAISPNSVNSSGGKGADTFGMWIRDIENEEPAQWLKSDPRGDMYRDVGNVDEYFKKYIVRPLKNFIMGSKDFNVEDEVSDEFEDSAENDIISGMLGEDDGD